MMLLRSTVFFIVSSLICIATAHPTMYKLNNNKILEAELVPVSSTVIPLPIYQVSSGLTYDEKKPVGPIPLITNGTKGKGAHKKLHKDEVSIVKEVKNAF